MKIDKRFFKINGQWNVVHLPEQPNGFAIMLIGNRNHYVDHKSSLWIQSFDRFQMIEALRSKGYTIFCSNLYGANWGSPEAIDLLVELYQLIIREHIINKKVHILAEGMGAITAIKLMDRLQDSVRSTALLSPCIDLKEQYSEEKESRLFYKRFISEMSKAYKIPEEEVVTKIINPFTLSEFTFTKPIKVWQATDRVAYSPLNHSRKLESFCKESKTGFELSFHMFEKRHHLGKAITSFFEKHEKEL